MLYRRSSVNRLVFSNRTLCDGKSLALPAGVWVDSWAHPTVQNSSIAVYLRLFADSTGTRCSAPRRARVAELADARDLGSRGQPWGFKSPLSHHPFPTVGNECVGKPKGNHASDENGSD